jgi:plastocyanin
MAAARRYAVVSAILALTVLVPGEAKGEQGVLTAFGFRYAPNPVHVAPGDTLAFLNLDPLAGEGHSVTHAVPPGEQLFDTPITPPGGAAEVGGVSDLRPGSYMITCRVHAFMTGTLVVELGGDR